jgi:signal transduction histidine kinase/Flp pilus assembly protein TadD
MFCRSFFATAGLWLMIAVVAPECKAGDESHSLSSGKDFRGLLASLEQPGEDPYQQLEELEHFYRQASDSHLDHGLRVASLYLDKAFSIGDSAHIAKGYHLRGTAYSRADDLLNAVKDYMKSLQISEAQGDSISMGNTYNNLGIVFERLENFEQALIYFEKSLAISREMNDQEGVAPVLNNLGNLYNNMGEKEKAFLTLMEALNAWKELNDTLAIAFSLGNIGNFFLSNEDYREAERYFSQAKSLFEKNNDLHNLAYTYLNLGETLHGRAHYQEALQKFRQGLQLVGEIKQPHLESQFQKSMAETYASLGNYEKAYFHELRYEALKDSILSEDAIRQISFYQTLYETESKEREIQLLRKEQELKELQLTQQNISLEKTRLQATILMFSLVISILAAIILVSRTRQKRRRMIDAEKLNNQKEQLKAILKTQEEERIRFARDLHDGLGQLLTALKINVSHMAPNQNGAPGASGEVASNLIREMHQEIRNISFNIMPQVLVQKGLLPALNELAHKINNAGSHTLTIREHGVTHRFEPPAEIAIYRILQELLNNIFKYSNASQINIQLTQHQDALNIHLEDDGVGFDTSRLEKGKGSGWKNICSRLRFIDGSIEYDSKPNRKYSTVIIDIPIK